MRISEIMITKRDGSLALFNKDKLEASLLRAGANEDQIQAVVSQLEGQIVDGITTKKLYKRAFELLNAVSVAHASRYRVKQDLKKLSETGYPFEHFIGKLLEKQGFETQVGVVVPGKCVTHEVDVFALRKGEHYMVECKFHPSKQGRCDVKNSLYVHARFQDLEQYWKKQPGHEDREHQGWLITNTRFTIDAIDYATCAGLRLLSWDFPNGNALRDQIFKHQHYPISCLRTFKKAELKRLVNAGIVTVDDLMEKSSVLNDLGVSIDRETIIIDEAKALLSQ